MSETHKIPEGAMQLLHHSNESVQISRLVMQQVVAALFAALDIDGQLVAYDSETCEIEVERADGVE